MAFEYAVMAPSACICYWVTTRVVELPQHERESFQATPLCLHDSATVLARLSTTQGCPVHEPAKPWPVEQCRSPRCGRNIIWAKTQNLRDMPVDAEPDPEGKLLLSWDFNVVRCTLTRTARQRFAKTLYTSHFATCRDADRYRVRSPR